jgi:hypothetical protein
MLPRKFVYALPGMYFFARKAQEKQRLPETAFYAKVLSERQKNFIVLMQ